jgi:hypothetical protein
VMKEARIVAAAAVRKAGPLGPPYFAWQAE